MSATFLPGTELARRYYLEIVRPLLDQHAPGLAYSAALIGSGSEVLGFDSARSTDHNWGPRCQVFLGPGQAGRAEELSDLLASELPETFLGWRVRFPDVSAPGWPVRHWVTVAELGPWLTGHLGFAPIRAVTVADWLAIPAQLLAEVTGGTVFHDELGLTAARERVAWYPDDVWRYLLACQWQRISQEEAFPGRCAESGDDLGSVIITARLARDAIRLAFLMRRRYPPYSKWLGTAFTALPGVGPLHQALTSALSAASWQDREHGLIAAFEELARWHNELGLTEPVDPAAGWFHDRPYRVIDAGRFSTAITSSISDDQLRDRPLTGAVDQFIDSTDALAALALRRAAIEAQPGGLGEPRE